MINELKQIETLLLETTQTPISNLIPEEESKEYLAYNFESEKLKFKFRKAKITPKKVGQFLTLWKRNSKQETEPFTASDNIDFYIILTQDNAHYGYFIFPKDELIKRQILSTELKEGKRGFRVYPTWVKTQNKQATKTQIWQTHYFLDFTMENQANKKRFIDIITNK